MSKNKLPKDVAKRFDEKFKPRCTVCLKHGVNNFGECRCSYELSELIIEKPKKVWNFIAKELARARKEENPLVLGDMKNMLHTLKEHPEINTGDWYEKTISYLEVKLNKERQA